MDEILQSLADPPSAKKILGPQLKTIKNTASQCHDIAMTIDKKFEAWLLHACEMHAACVEQENSTRDSLLSNTLCLAAEQTRLEYQKSSVEEAAKASKLLGEQVGLAGDAFKKASEEFPTG